MAIHCLKCCVGVMMIGYVVRSMETLIAVLRVKSGGFGKSLISPEKIIATTVTVCLQGDPCCFHHYWDFLLLLYLLLLQKAWHV